MSRNPDTDTVRVPISDATLEGSLTIPEGSTGIVVFAHGSGSSRFSPRNRYVAGVQHDAGIATLLFDLLTPDEERIDQRTRHLRFDINLLARRLAEVADWVATNQTTQRLSIGYFGSSTGGGAALVAAALRPDLIAAVVSRGGRPDLAGDALPNVESPTLLIVGERDEPVIEMNRSAMAQMRCPVELEIVPGASHLFEEPGTLEQVAGLARDWFLRHLRHPG